jgi:ATP/ADP translocase
MPKALQRAGRTVERLLGAELRPGEWHLALLFFAKIVGKLGVHVGFAFFVWLGIFSTVAIAQFWSLATDVLREEEGKRLFPMVAAGGTLGGIFGAQISARLIDGHPHTLMLVAALP